ncbi:hypothetical protein FH972_018815 [Carpinus fangiana]|uniref:TF-B3 domain-containing protein n=1 Tax=Carpinus fangiana TaxID=176857 RepID=A0A5N6RN68_9ROSI|nr:hypothetical protein FH972_018815 [Carpinus fangiana]
MAWMSTKVLTRSDINEGRVYLPEELAGRFGVPNGTQVSVCGPQMNNIWQMKFITRADGRSYLGRAWGEFVERKGLREGETVDFYDLGHIGANGERLFRIERRGVGFDLNEPAPDNY